MVFLCAFVREGNPWSWLLPGIENILANLILVFCVLTFFLSPKYGYALFWMVIFHLGTHLLIAVTKFFFQPNLVQIWLRSLTISGNMTADTFVSISKFSIVVLDG